MVFALEALNARFGDSLLLYYGQSDDPTIAPKLIVIDGGPRDVWDISLKPTLDAIQAERFPGEPNTPLPIRMVMVSHIDDDHIRGILKMMRMLQKRQEDGLPLPYDIATLWHNSFDDLLGNEAQELTASFAASVEAASAGGSVTGIAEELFKRRPEGHDHGDGEAITASVLQGRELRQLAMSLGLNINSPFDGLVVAGREGKRIIDIGDGLSFHLIGPLEPEVKALQTEWNEVLVEKNLVQTAQFLDNSVFNLSSIVVLAKMGDKTMLLTGDARGDKVMEGLEREGLLPPGGTMKVDLLKLPHHGSDHNVAPEFFERIIADHYVASGDGVHGNPEIKTLQMLSDARGNNHFTLYLTNREARLHSFFAEEEANGKTYEVVFRDDNERSVLIAL